MGMIKKLFFFFAATLFSATSVAQDIEIIGGAIVCVDGIWYQTDDGSMWTGGDEPGPKSATVIANPNGDYYKGKIVIPDEIEYEGESYPVEAIGDGAFEAPMEWNPDPWDIGEPVSQSEITSITLPDNIMRIGASAFYGCSGLTSFRMPSGVMEIGEEAFSFCDGLQAVYTDNIGSWCNILFMETCSNPLSCAGKLYVNNQLLTDLTDFPQWMTGIGEFTFSGCTSLKSVTIPATVRSIATCAFESCENLENVRILGSETSIAADAFGSCYNIKSVELHTANIGTWFANKNIQNLIMGNEVLNIEKGAFKGCKNLTSVTIPNSVMTIGESAFENCNGLTAVTISKNASSIGDKAFYGCKNLKAVTVMSKKPASITENVFPYRSTQTLYVPKGCVETYEEAEYWWQFLDILEKGSSTGGLKGDMNDDGVISITDVMILVNVILGLY